jgi:hypothetical protein
VLDLWMLKMVMMITIALLVVLNLVKVEFKDAFFGLIKCIGDPSFALFTHIVSTMRIQ